MDDEAADAELQQCRLLHQALRQAARTRLDDPARALVATDLSLVFSAAPAGPLQARALATGGGRSVCFCEAELLDSAERTVARAMATFRYQCSGVAQP